MTMEEPKDPMRRQLPVPGWHRELRDRTFVYANGPLAEVLCDAYLMELTVERARELRESHRRHQPDECCVHLQAAARQLLSGD